MAKKKQNRKANAESAQAAADAAAAEAARPLLVATSTAVAAQEALQPVLEQLDAIAQEAHVYTQQLKQQQQQQQQAEVNTAVASPQSKAQAHKRPREDAAAEVGDAPKAMAPSASRLDVFAVTSALQYQALCAAVTASGLQLLPSLADIAKRVTLAVLTPALSTPEAWEALAVLCTTYRAGMSHAAGEVLESLLREPGVLLLDAPQLVPEWYAEAFVHVLPGACASNTFTAAYGGLLAFAEDQQMREPTADGSVSASSSFARLARVHTDRIARKLRALVDVVYAVGDYVPSCTLQQFALRHAVEVVEGGLLPCFITASEAGVENVATFKSAASGTPANGGAAARDEAADASQILRWRVPPAWHAECLQLLEAFLFTIRPAVPAQLLVTAAHTITVVSGRLHRGLPVFRSAAPSKDAGEDEKHDAPSAVAAQPLPVSHAVSAAAVRLGHVLHVLRHPVVLAPFQPAQLTLEKAKRRVWTIDAAPQDDIRLDVAPATATAAAAPHAPLPPATVVTSEVSAPVPATPPVSVASAPIPSSAPVAVAAAAAAPSAVSRAATVVKSAAPSPPPQPLPRAPAPTPVPVPAVQQAAPEDDDLPDIVMDD